MFFHKFFEKKSIPLTWGDYTGYDKDLEWAISVGLAERDGNIIQFSPDFERMATWQWTWKHGEDKR